MKKCPGCNYTNDDDANFCTVCGEPLGQGTPAGVSRSGESSAVRGGEPPFLTRPTGGSSPLPTPGDAAADARPSRQSNINIRVGHQEGNISVQKGGRGNAPGEQSDINIRAGFHEGDISVNRGYSLDDDTDASLSKRLSPEDAGYEVAGQMPPAQSSSNQMVKPVIVDGFEPSPEDAGESVFALTLTSNRGFRKKRANRATIIVKNLSNRTFKDMKLLVEGTIEDEELRMVKTSKATVKSLPPGKQCEKSINIYAFEAGDVEIRLVVEYKDESGEKFKCAPTAWIDVADKGEEIPQTVQNIINNNYRIGYIDGDIRTLQPIDQSKKTQEIVGQPIDDTSRWRRAVRLQCHCRATLKPDADRCRVCGMQVLNKCPRCEARLWPDDFTCPECTMEIHRKVKLNIDFLESISGLRSRLTVQTQRCGETEWSAPVKNLLIRSSARFRLGRYYKTDNPKHANDLVLVVHCLDEPRYDQWHKSNSKTAKLSKRLSRRQMDIVYHDGRFLITWINEGKQVYLEKMGTADKVELDCNREYKLQDGDILNIRGTLRFRFKLLHIEVDQEIKTIGACLERQRYRDCPFTKTSFDKNGKEVRECTRKTEECLNHIGCCDNKYELKQDEREHYFYEHYFHNHYLFPKLLYIGGDGTDGLAIDCPGLAKNRFKITAHENRLRIIDLHRKNPKPRKKIECF